MKSLVAALAALLLCAPAFADQAPETPLVTGPNMQQTPASQILIKVPGSTIQTLGAALSASGCTTNCTLSNPTITGGSFSGGAVAATTLNVTGTSGLQIGGLNALSISAATGNQAMWAGVGAGAALPANAGWATFFGTGAGQNQSITNENTGIGALACNQVTTGSFDTCLGLHSIGFETTGSDITASGNDAMRNSVGSGFTVSDGVSAGRDGAAPWSVFVGTQAGQANSSSVALGGTITVGDVVHLAFASSSPNVTGFPATASYTVKSGDTLASVASGLVSPISALGIGGQGVLLAANTSAVTGGPPTIGLDFPGTATSGWAVTTTFSVTGAGTETATIGTGFVGHDNVFAGFAAGVGAGATTAANDVILGSNAAPFITTASSDLFAGMHAAFNVQTSIQSVVLGAGAAPTLVSGAGDIVIGSNADVTSGAAFQSIVIGSNSNGGAIGARGGTASVVIGSQAGNANLTGQFQTLIGQSVGSTTDATGNNVVLIGTSSACDTPTSSTGNYVALCAGAGPVVSVSGAGTPATSVTQVAGALNIAAPFTVATLPPCNTAADGTWSKVTDATAPTYNGALTGGGTVHVPAYCNGAAWTSH